MSDSPNSDQEPNDNLLKILKELEKEVKNFTVETSKQLDDRFKKDSKKHRAHFFQSAAMGVLAAVALAVGTVQFNKNDFQDAEITALKAKVTQLEAQRASVPSIASPGFRDATTNVEKKLDAIRHKVDDTEFIDPGVKDELKSAIDALKKVSQTTCNAEVQEQLNQGLAEITAVLVAKHVRRERVLGAEVNLTNLLQKLLKLCT